MEREEEGQRRRGQARIRTQPYHTWGRGRTLSSRAEEPFQDSEGPSACELLDVWSGM